MNILHISNGFADSKVHSNLVKSLDALGIKQIVYCPVREERLVGRNKFVGNHVNFSYSYCIKSWYKFFYYYKERKLYKDLKSNVDLSKVDFIHAHTLFSDGGLAYKVYKEYGVKYAVAIRNTDVNYYLRFMKHAYPYGRKILLNAEKIFFISVGLKNIFERSSFCKPIYSQIKDKFVAQPNGIDDFWHQHISRDRVCGHNILYVGDFSANKNVVRLCEGVLKLKEEAGFEDVNLTIVGGEVLGGARKNDGKTQQMIDKHPDVIRAVGKIYDKSELMSIMKSCSLFAMPSITETFGLVYVEALSQNLPVIYTIGQGIDGMFDESVGIGVNAFSVVDIKDAIKTVLLNPEKYSNKNVHFKDFKWDVIAHKYLAIYNEIIR